MGQYDESGSEYDEDDDYYYEERYRRNILDTLQFEVVEEDVFHTELRRKTHDPDHDDTTEESFLDKFFSITSSFSSSIEPDTNQEETLNRQQIRELLDVAQEMGIVGAGVHDYFPEILELSWPPEGRLIERDCTCDLWDKIRYRY